MPQKVKDLVLSMGWLGQLLWCGFNPWTGNFLMPKVWLKKKKKVVRNKKTKLNSMAPPSPKYDSEV